MSLSTSISGGGGGAGGGSGDVAGPASSTDEAVARFNGAGGKTLQNSVVTITDAGIVAGATQLNVDNLRLDGNTLSSTSGNIAVTAASGGTVTLNNGDGTATVFAYNFSALGGDNFSLHQDFGFRLRSTYAVNWFSSTVGAGSADVGLARNAADVLRVTDGSTGVGSTLTKRLVEANTAGVGAPNLLAATESRTLLSNEGATAMNHHTLPAAAAGLEFIFYVQDADGITVTAGASDTIRVAGSVSSAAGTAANSTIGSVLHLVAVNAVEWVAIASTGTWTLT